MKNNDHTLSFLSVTILSVLILISNTQFLSFSPNSVYATTQQQDEISENTDDSSGDNVETNTSQENAGSEQSDNGPKNIEAVDSESQSQVQQTSQTDTLSPNVLSVTPNIGTSGIPVTTTITATFSEPVDSSTVTATTFTLETDNNKVQGSTSVSSDGTTAIFTPSSSLSDLTVYTATISEVKDLAGNTMNFNSPWSFTTEAQTTPPPPSQQEPPQQPSPSTPPNPGGGGTGNSGGGGTVDDIKISPSESGVLNDAAQYAEDEKMVDRILPIILSKMDKRQLAETVLPYLDLQVSVRQAEGETITANGDTARAITPKGSCGPDEILIGGGFQAGGASKIYFAKILDNQWNVYAEHDPIFDSDSTSSTTASYPICLKAELVPRP